MTILLSDPAAAASGPRLDVDLGAVADNTRLLAARATGSLMAVVKADGFGHGALDVARTALAHGATSLGVTALTEAWPLRDAGIDAPLLSWLNPVDADFAEAVRRRVDVAVPSLEHLAAVAAAPGRARIHLHLDCGMARDGASPAAWPRLCRAARRAEQRGEVEVVGVMGHLGCSRRPRRRLQRPRPESVRLGSRDRSRLRAASGAAPPGRDGRHPHRPADPPHDEPGRRRAGRDRPQRDDAAAARDDADRAARLGTTGGAGTAVGYGHAHRAPVSTYLGLVPLGYADGLPRQASDRAEVQHRGRRATVVGMVSMDQVVVDLGPDGGEPGDTVTVFGPGDAGEPTVAEWAAWAGTLEHEIVTGLGTRVARRVHAVPRLRSVR